MEKVLARASISLFSFVLAASFCMTPVFPNAMTGTVSLAITATQGGSVSYVSSVASGNLHSSTVKIKIAAGTDITLTETPDSGNYFAAWGALPGTTLSSCCVHAPSITIAVDSSSHVVGSFNVVNMGPTSVVLSTTNGASVCPEYLTGVGDLATWHAKTSTCTLTNTTPISGTGLCISTNVMAGNCVLIPISDL